MKSPVDPTVRRLVIFDCDGVLVDSERIVHTVLAHRLLDLGVALTLSETVEAFIGGSDARDLAVIEELTGSAPSADFIRRFERETKQALELVAPVDGVFEALDCIGGDQCVASNGSRAKMQQTLGRTGLLARFQGRIFSAEDVAFPKPAPDVYLLACATLGYDPTECVVIEDTAIGVAAARAAGMLVFGFAGLTPSALLRAAGAHCVFESMADLDRLLSTSPGNLG